MSFKTPKGTELPFLNLKGKDYLQVAHRILWLREEHPDWVIKTQILKLESDYCVMKATIEDADGRTIAEAHQMTTKAEFPKFLAKCETSAIGRALGVAGFGTQFAQELVDDEEDLADSPLPKTTKKAEYICTFGKFKGQPIKDIPTEELADYVSYIEKGIQDNPSKKPQPSVVEFLQEAKKCLK